MTLKEKTKLENLKKLPVYLKAIKQAENKLTKHINDKNESAIKKIELSLKIMKNQVELIKG